MPLADPAEQLPAAALILWRSQTVLGCLAVWIVAGIAGWYWRDVDWVPWAAMAGAALAGASTAVDLVWLLPRRLVHYRYDVTGAGLRVHQGFLVSRRLVVPAGQILYVEVRQGPMHRRLGLASVQVGTLGSVHELGPLDVPTAGSIAARQLGREVADAPL